MRLAGAVFIICGALPQPTWAQDCAASFNRLTPYLSIIESRPHLDSKYSKTFPFKIRTKGVGGKSFILAQKLGDGQTSEVFVDASGKYLVKIYQRDLGGIENPLPFLERALTDYYRENGLYTPPIVFGPAYAKVGGEKVTVVVREYRKGLTESERYEARIHWRGADPIFDRVEELHENSRFRDWLVERKKKYFPRREIELATFSLAARNIDEGDAKPDNVLFGENGWFLNDP